MAIRRFKSRATAGRVLKAGTLGQLTALSDITTTAERGDGQAGTLDLSLYTLIAGVVAAEWVVEGHDNYTGGDAGTYPTSATSYALGYTDGEIAGAATQLASDQATVLASAEWIVSGHSILGQAGTFPIGDYTLTSGIVWPALDEVDGGVNFGPVTGTEYEGTGMTATDVGLAIDSALGSFAGDTGITLAKGLEMLAAYLAGKISRSSVGGVTTLSYKKRDGTTVSFTAACDEGDGDRATTGSLS